jgi:hypothetical protein
MYRGLSRELYQLQREPVLQRELAYSLQREPWVCRPVIVEVKAVD